MIHLTVSNPQKVILLHHWASWLDASLLGMATAPPFTTSHYRGWCGQPSTLLGPSSLPSRTSISSDVKGRAGKLLKTPTTQVIDCSLCISTASGTSASSLTPTGSWTASIPKQYDWWWIANKIATWTEFTCIFTDLLFQYLLCHSNKHSLHHNMDIHIYWLYTHASCCYSVSFILQPSHLTPIHIYLHH